MTLYCNLVGCTLTHLLQLFQHAQESLWQLGTQPIMLLVAHGQWEWLDPQWNVNGESAPPPLLETLSVSKLFCTQALAGTVD